MTEQMHTQEHDSSQEREQSARADVKGIIDTATWLMSNNANHILTYAHPDEGDGSVITVQQTVSADSSPESLIIEYIEHPKLNRFVQAKERTLQVALSSLGDAEDVRVVETTVNPTGRSYRVLVAQTDTTTGELSFSHGSEIVGYDNKPDSINQRLFTKLDRLHRHLLDDTTTEDDFQRHLGEATERVNE